MQLSLEGKFATYTPPRNQLLKWVGNKQRFASQISSYFPADFGTFYEPFLGSGAVMATISPQHGVGSDVFAPLMEIWHTLKEDPLQLVEWYAERRNRLDTEIKEAVYDDVRSSFNNAANGADFLFLSRSCYGGIVRFRKRDGFMSTPCGAHTPIAVENFRKRVNEWHGRVKGVDFRTIDFSEAFDLARAGDLVYCDPPYTHSQSILYGAQSFKLETLLEKIAEVKHRGVRVALSIDGNKKSGDYLCDLPIPKGLFEEEIYVSVGRSMLKRFQMEGKTLESEHVSDRLLLTYSLD